MTDYPMPDTFAEAVILAADRTHRLETSGKTTDDQWNEFYDLNNKVVEVSRRYLVAKDELDKAHADIEKLMKKM